MKRILGILLLFITLATNSSLVKGQLVKCRICNVKTGEGIAFSSIATRDAKKGCSSDIDGFFFANLNDTVKISSLGYLPKNAVVSKVPSIGNIRILNLEETSLQLQEFKVIGRNNEKRDYISLTSYKDKDKKGIVYNRPGSRFAIQMDNNLNREGLIEKLTFKFKINRDRKKIVNLRLRVYNIKNASQKIPGDDLLLENIIITPKNGWNTIDVSKYNISFLKGGVFIGLDLLESNTINIYDEHLNPGICYYSGKGCSPILENYRESGWKSDQTIKLFGPGCMILKMEISVNR